MKILILILSLVFVTEIANCQDTINGRAAVIKLPKGSRKISNDTYLDYSKKKFHVSRIRFPNNRIFTNGNLLVSINESDFPKTSHKNIQQRKDELDEVFNSSSFIVKESKIIVVNQAKYIVFNYHDGDVGHLCIYSDKINNKIISTIIDYKLIEEKQAYQYMDGLLQGLYFKHYED